MDFRKKVGLVVAIAAIVGSILLIENPFATQAVETAGRASDIRVGTDLGQRLPNFNLETIDGEKVSLNDYRGKVVFVNFWATWCPFCVDEIPDLERAFEEYGGDVAILGINRAESLQKQTGFLSDLQLRPTYPLLLDPSDNLAGAYGVVVMPTTFILDREGVITQVKLGQFINLDEIRQAVEAAELAPEPLVQAKTKTPEIDIFDLEQVLMAGEGDVVGTRGEKLMITNGIRHIIPLNEILSGGPPPDGIPPIENPKYISAVEANAFLSDDEFVLGITYEGISRAYPLQILVWHEIVNDEFSGKLLLITYCPLCFTGIAFKPFIGDEPVTFGTSGKLYNSDLVMYDRKTSSYWSQITGQAIRGELAGLALEKVPIDTIRWGDWKKIHPNTQVLSRDTGFNRAYGQEPYGGYYQGGGPIFPIANSDSRLPEKSIVHGVSINGLARAYPEQSVADVGGIVNDVVGSLSLLIVQDPDQITKPDRGLGSKVVSSRVTRIFDRMIDGITLDFEIIDGKLFDEQTGSEWSFEGMALSGPHEGKRLARIASTPEFWFSWSSFYPDTEIFQAN